MDYHWIAYSKHPGFSWKIKTNTKSKFDVFISDLTNCPMKNFDSNIYWNDKLEELKKIFDL